MVVVYLIGKRGPWVMICPVIIPRLPQRMAQCALLSEKGNSIPRSAFCVLYLLLQTKGAKNAKKKGGGERWSKVDASCEKIRMVQDPCLALLLR